MLAIKGLLQQRESPPRSLDLIDRFPALQIYLTPGEIGCSQTKRACRTFEAHVFSAKGAM